MVHEADFREVAPIDWARIARAYEWYRRHGYRYVEVPWAVPSSVVAATIPADAQPLRIADIDSVLIGSAEQGILDLEWNAGGLGAERYFAISPCFRGEERVVPGHRQLTFMKVELYVRNSEPNSVWALMETARAYMIGEGARLEEIPTDVGVDLYCGGLEVGSYGSRRVRGLEWSYGTGLAEPRFSTALRNIGRVPWC